MGKLYILVEPTPDLGWICYNGEEMDKERCLRNGGWVMDQEDVDRIFGNFVPIVSPLNTHVSEDGKTVTFDRPSDEERSKEKAELLENRISVLLRQCDNYFNTFRSEQMTSYQKKIWHKYRQDLVDFKNLPGYPWLDQEQPPFPTRPEENAVPKTLEDLKEFRLEELVEIFNGWMDSPDASIQSSTGYMVNANNTAKKNVDGLITAMESTGVETITFMCFDNNPAQLTLQQLKTIQLELIQRGSALYARKWFYRSQIESAQTMEEVNSIEFDFSDVTIN